uniref:Centromere protein Q n=1 Tax=Xenopus tropicalis TaxID=8364 RepID=A0A6I8QBE3_XENTR
MPIKNTDECLFCFSHRYMEDKLPVAGAAVTGGPLVRKQNHQSLGLKAKSSKIQGLKGLNGRSVQGIKANVYKPLANSILEHIEMCLEAAILSVSHDLRTPPYAQDSLKCLKQKLLCHCKKMKAPTTKMSILKNLKKDVFGELQRMEASEETITCLEDNIENALDASDRIKEQIVDFEQKMDSRKKVIHFNTLLLPSASFQAPTMQEYVGMLKNPTFLLKDLQVIESCHLSTYMRDLIEKSYSEAECL